MKRIQIIEDDEAIRTELKTLLLAFSVGGDDFIRKPYNSAVLLARISRMLKNTDGNTLYVNIGRLREKLGQIGAADFVRTVRGVGYRL